MPRRAFSFKKSKSYDVQQVQEKVKVGDQKSSEHLLNDNNNVEKNENNNTPDLLAENANILACLHKIETEYQDVLKQNELLKKQSKKQFTELNDVLAKNRAAMKNANKQFQLINLLRESELWTRKQNESKDAKIKEIEEKELIFSKKAFDIIQKYRVKTHELNKKVQDTERKLECLTDAYMKKEDEKERFQAEAKLFESYTKLLLKERETQMLRKIRSQCQKPDCTICEPEREEIAIKKDTDADQEDMPTGGNTSEVQEPDTDAIQITGIDLSYVESLHETIAMLINELMIARDQIKRDSNANFEASQELMDEIFPASPTEQDLNQMGDTAGQLQDTNKEALSACSLDDRDFGDVEEQLQEPVKEMVSACSLEDFELKEDLAEDALKPIDEAIKSYSTEISEFEEDLDALTKCVIELNDFTLI